MFVAKPIITFEQKVPDTTPGQSLSDYPGMIRITER